jgi:hypothetical protein
VRSHHEIIDICELQPGQPLRGGRARCHDLLWRSGLAGVASVPVVPLSIRPGGIRRGGRASGGGGGTDTCALGTGHTLVTIVHWRLFNINYIIFRNIKNFTQKKFEERNEFVTENIESSRIFYCSK